MKKLILAAFAAFFMSSAYAKDLPKPIPKPECLTINQFLLGMDYSIGYHRNYPHAAFAYVPRLDAIIILTKSGHCLDRSAGLVLPRGTSVFKMIYNNIIAGKPA